MSIPFVSICVHSWFLIWKPRPPGMPGRLEMVSCNMVVKYTDCFLPTPTSAILQELGILSKIMLARSRDMGLSFSQAEIFPMIARLIIQGSACGNGFVEHPTIVSLLLADAEGSIIVQRAATSSGFTDIGGVAANMVAWFSQRISVNDSPWVAFFDRERRSNAWAYRPVISAHPTILSECDRVAIEGNPQMYFHLRRERDPAITKAKRDAFVAIHGTLHCECCSFDTNSMFSGLGYDVCEIHHRVPLTLASEPVKTTFNDLAVLCPNCHRAIHKTHPLMSVEEFSLHFFGASRDVEIG